VRELATCRLVGKTDDPRASPAVLLGTRIHLPADKH